LLKKEKENIKVLIKKDTTGYFEILNEYIEKTIEKIENINEIIKNITSILYINKESTELKNQKLNNFSKMNEMNFIDFLLNCMNNKKIEFNIEMFNFIFDKVNENYINQKNEFIKNMNLSGILYKDNEKRFEVLINVVNMNILIIKNYDLKYYIEILKKSNL
jgi:hypothetical protein